MSEKEKIIKAIGIDLGTTHSCVGIFRNGRVEIATNDIGARVTPSIVAFTPKDVTVGAAAKNIMGRYAKSTIYDSKRLIGRKFDDPIVQQDRKYWPFEIERGDNDLPKYKIDIDNPNKKEYPIEISTIILKKLKQFGTDLYGEEVKKAVITVPAYFNNSQREATKKAGEMAGFEEVRILNEPTAAAIAYGYQNKSDKEKIVLVFDLGGGTFDVSIVKIYNKNYEVLAINGDSHLGGEDFNNLLVDYIVKDFSEMNDIDLKFNKKAMRRIIKSVEEAKIDLSNLNEVTIDIDGICEGEDLNMVISRPTYEELCEDL
jgi:L1 cell adhesion molecule like protein